MNQSRVKYLLYCFALSFGFLYIFLISFETVAQNDGNLTRNNKTADIIISEISDPLTNKGSRFIELYNPTEASIDLLSESYYLCRQNNSGSIKSILLTGIIYADSTYICIYSVSDFVNEYGSIYDQQSTHWGMNGNDSFFLVKGGEYGEGNVIDTYGQYGVNGSGESWEYADAHAVRKREFCAPSPIWDRFQWVIIEAGSGQMTPGQHNVNVSYNAASDSWNTRGNWSGMGYVPDASYNVTINSVVEISIDASSVCNNLTIGEGAKIRLVAGKDLQVVDSLVNLEGLDGLVLYSNANGCSSLIHYSNDVEAKVYSYFPDLNLWYFVSSPIENATAQIFYGEYLSYWYEPTGNWMYVTDENEILQPGNAYSLKKSESNNCIYEGELNTGTILIDSLRYTETNASEIRGWNLIGNPYPSVLDFNQVDLEGKNINAGISVWPHNGTEVSSYISWSQGGGSPVGDDEARYIQPGQGFMIQVYEDLEFFELDNSCRTNVDRGVFDKSQAKTETNSDRTLVIELFGENTTKDKTYFALRDNATLFFDKESDVKKLFGDAQKPHVFSYAGFQQDIPLSINCIDSYHENKEYYLGVRSGISGVYSLNMCGIQSFQGENIWILDELENTLYSLETDSLITFYYEVGEPEKRFKIIFDEEVAINNLDLKTSEIGVYIHSNSLYLSGYNCEEDLARVQVFDLLGRLLMEHAVYVGFDGLQLHLSSAYYIVGVEYKNTTTYHKVFISSNNENI